MVKKGIFAVLLLLSGLCYPQGTTRTGQVVANPGSNGVDIFSSTRQTDSAPSGNFINFKSLAGVTLFKVDINGNVTAPSFTTTSFFSVPGITSTKVSRDCRQDGVVGDGVTDDSTAINNCLTNAFAANENVVLPAGSFKVSTSLNDTNKPGMTIKGTATSDISQGNTNITHILCNTGNRACLDRVGSSKSGIENITFESRNSYSTPSQIIILMGRDNATDPNSGHSFCFSEFIHDRHFFIDTDVSVASINGGLGYIGIYNVGAELYTIEDSGLFADVPAWFDSTNGTIAATSAYQTLATGCAASMETIISSNTAYGVLSNQGLSAITFNGTNNGNHSFLSGLCETGNSATSSCMRVLSNGLYGTTVLPGFTWEQQNAPGAFLLTSGPISGSTFAPSTSVPVGSSSWFQFSGSPTITDTTFKVTKINAGDTVQQLLGNTTATINGGELGFAGTATPVSAANVTLNGTIVKAPGISDTNIPSTAFNVASYFVVSNSSGITFYGGGSGTRWGTKGVSNNVGSASAVVAQPLASGNNVAYGWKQIGAGSDQNVWDARVGSTGNWFLSALNDAENSLNVALEIDRTGFVLNAIKLGTKVTSYNGIALTGNGLVGTFFQDDRTSQSATIGPITIVTGTASTGGHYRMCQAQGTTATDASGATYAITFNWTSEGISRTTAGGSLTVASTGQQGSFCTAANIDASTNMTYTVTVTGTPTTGRFAQHVWAARE